MALASLLAAAVVPENFVTGLEVFGSLYAYSGEAGASRPDGGIRDIAEVPGHRRVRRRGALGDARSNQID